MNELPPLPRDQRQVDTEHLRLLAIFHFIGAGLALLAICFLFVHYMGFRMIFDNPEMWTNPQQGPSPAEFLGILKWFYLAFGTWFLGSLILNLLSGLYMLARKNRIFSLVVAAINCLYMPFGTALGVFTIIVLMRNSVRESYDANNPGVR